MCVCVNGSDGMGKNRQTLNSCKQHCWAPRAHPLSSFKCLTTAGSKVCASVNEARGEMLSCYTQNSFCITVFHKKVDAWYAIKICANKMQVPTKIQSTTSNIKYTFAHACTFASIHPHRPCSHVQPYPHIRTIMEAMDMDI